MIPNFVKEREEKGLPFDLYFAGSQCKLCDDWLKANKVCRLLSYYYHKTDIKSWIEEANKESKLFVDSGAFTAFTKGKEIDVDTYIEYLNKMSPGFTIFAQMDYIRKGPMDDTDAAEKSWENYLYMYERLNEPDKLLPVFHQGEPFQALQNMVEFKKPNGEYMDYIALGALVGTGVTIPQKIDFFSKCFNVILGSKNPNIKVHAMGMTSLELLERFPFYSADSTAWIMQGVTGSIFTPWGNFDVSDNTKNAKTNLRNQHPEVIQKVKEYLESIGINYEELFTDYRYKLMCNLITLQNWANNYKYKGGDIKVRNKSLFATNIPTVKPILRNIPDIKVQISSIVHEAEIMEEEMDVKEDIATVTVEEQKLPEIKATDKATKAIVLTSGGVDSSTCLAMAVDELGCYNVSSVVIHYGQRHEREVQSAKAIADFYDVKQYEFDVSDIFQYSNCSLMKTGQAVVESTYQEQFDTGEKISSYVPFRNGLMLSICATLAQSLYPNDKVDIYLGNHGDDFAYADCTPAFVEKMQAAISEGTYGLVNFRSPLNGMTKAAIVDKGIHLGVPYNITWSCYEGGELPCGKCASCLCRKEAFELSGYKDPVKYMKLVP